MTRIRIFTLTVLTVLMTVFAADAQFRQPGEGGGTAGTVPPIHDAPRSLDNPAEPNENASPQTRVNNIRGGTHAARRLIDQAFVFQGTIEKDAIFVPDSEYGYKITKQKFEDMQAARVAKREAEAAKEKIKAAMVVASSGSATTKAERELAFDMMVAANDMAQEITVPEAGANLEAWKAYRDHVQEMYLLAANTVGSMKANQDILPLLIADGLVATTAYSPSSSAPPAADETHNGNHGSTTTVVHDDNGINWWLIGAVIILLPLVLFYGFKAYKVIFTETKDGVKGFWGKRRDKKTSQLAEAIAQANKLQEGNNGSEEGGEGKVELK